MNREIVFGSVCSGIEAASVAWKPLGWRCAFISEIDPFASHVLHHHYSCGRPIAMPDPDEDGLSSDDRKERAAAINAVAGLPVSDGLKNAGDFTTIEAGQYEPIDVLIGGTPCQDFSIAGLRAGIAGERGNLTLEFLRLADRLRPEWLVWENVPGVLSSDAGRALGAFLGGAGRTRVWVRLPRS